MSGPAALPPVPPAASAGPPPAPAAATGTLSGSAQLLAALAALGRSGTVTATVLSAADAGTPAQLLTALGPVAIEAPLPLPAGAVVTLQPAPDQPGAVTILAVDNVAPHGAAAASGTAAPAPPPIESPPAIVALGTLVAAIVVADAAPASPQAVPVPRSAGIDAPAPAGAADAASPATAAAAPSPPPASGGDEAAGTATPTKGPAVADSIPAPRLSPGLLLLQEIAPAKAAPPAAAPTAPREPEAPASPEAVPPIPDENAAPTTSAAPSGRPVVEPAAAAPRALPPGTGLALRILAAQPPASSAAGAWALGGTIRSIAGGAAVVATAAGPLILTPAPPLPRGTPLTLRLAESEVAGRPAAMVAVERAVAPHAPTPVAARAAPPDAAEPASASPPAAPAATKAAPAAPDPEASAAEPAGAAAPKPNAPRPAAEAPLYRVSLPATPIGGTAGTAQPTTLIGRVLAEPTHAAATTLLATPLGRLAILPRLAVPPGTLLLLALPDPAGVAAPADPSRPIEESWPALHAALGVLGRTAPDLAQQFTADLSAGAGKTLAAALLLVVAALRGDTRIAWPGADVERALALAGHGDLTTQLAGDVGALRQIAAAPATAPWQVFLLPVFDGTAIRPLRLYVKDRGDGSGRGRRREEESRRFILEFELSRLGALQLDGFVRPRRFDLVLRSRAPLAPPLRGEVTRIFHDRIAAAGIAGEIEFATCTRFEVAPLEALRRPVGLAV